MMRYPVRWRLSDGFHRRSDEFGGEFRHDCVSVTAETHHARFGCRFGIDRCARIAAMHHASGKAINQRECAGFNAPRFSVPAGDNGEVVPEARLASFAKSFPSGFVPVVAMPGLSFGLIAINACVDVESVRILPVLLPKM